MHRPTHPDQGDSMRGAPLPKKACISLRQAKISKRRQKDMKEVPANKIAYFKRFENVTENVQ